MADMIVLGAAGTVGKAIVRDLAEKGYDVIASDMDEGRLEDVKKWTGKDMETIKLNINNVEEAQQVIKRAKVCVNATNYAFNLKVMEACAAAGVHVVDLGGLFTMTKEQLKLDEKMAEANVLSIIGIGSDPGASNVFSRYGVDQLDQAEEVHIRFGSTTSGVTFPFAIDTIIDEVTKNAVTYRNNDLVEIPPLSEEELTSFHDEIGTQRTYSIIHSELVTLPKSFPELKVITYKDSWDPATIEKVKVLEELGLLREETIEENGDHYVPRRRTVSMLRETLKEEEISWGQDVMKVEVKGIKDNKKTSVTVEILCGFQEGWEIGPTAYATAMPASIAAQMIIKGEVNAVGVKPPEVCLDPEKFLQYLAEKNVRIFTTINEQTELQGEGKKEKINS
ncbi:saccharopine dehydrogenase family protein [Bacillus piscicola]|uniref:saccharopine dehydrogenase family protein n=1 Tax=Bacillus piscicola TaxID=1632684 RepID=UPI001F096EEE|nr:SDR family NAD(P)-dependent oxidoreductase [Bacillus piscicola]